MLYYTIIITNLDGTITKLEKLNHVSAIQHINNTIHMYGFNKPINVDTFHNILCRPHLLPERLRWVMNTGKISIERTNQPKAKHDIVEFMQSLPEN